MIQPTSWIECPVKLVDAPEVMWGLLTGKCTVAIPIHSRFVHG